MASDQAAGATAAADSGYRPQAVGRGGLLLAVPALVSSPGMGSGTAACSASCPVLQAAPLARPSTAWGSSAILLASRH